VLVADDQRADSLGCAGNTILKTPHIDALAAGGVRFRQSFATTAICPSSRASIFSGLHTRCHGVDDFDKFPLPAVWANSYPMQLRAAGYHTGFVGKWGVSETLPKDDFDYFVGFTGQGMYFEPGRTKHLTTLQADQAVDFLHGCRADKPFCLSVSFKAPHVQDEGRSIPGIYAKYPYDLAFEPLFQNVTVPFPKTVDVTPQPEFLKQSLNGTREAPDFSPANYQEAIKALYRLVTGIDVAVGRIMSAVRDIGAEQNTVVMYTSDHGSIYGEHGFGGKWIMYEESIRSPLILYDPRLPSQIRGTTRDEMVLNIDRSPTLLNLAGIDVPPAVQGKSLLPLVYATSPVPWRSDWFYEQTFRLGGSIVATEGIRTDQWKYVRYIDTRPVYEQLFNLNVDPREETNLATDARYQDTLNRLRDRWTVWGDGLNSWRNDVPWTDPV
jgi:arylsulfatase A-like enzyme